MLCSGGSVYSVFALQLLPHPSGNHSKNTMSTKLQYIMCVTLVCYTGDIKILVVVL